MQKTISVNEEIARNEKLLKIGYGELMLVILTRLASEVSELRAGVAELERRLGKTPESCCPPAGL